MFSETKKVLDDLPKYFPDYDPKQGYEIAGFIWVQGWNDAIGDGNPEYVEQMAHFIRDMREDLKAPKLPFVIGELGTDGPGGAGWFATFRKQQAEIVAMEEFKGNVALAKTAQYWPGEHLQLIGKWDEFREAAKVNAQKKDAATRLEPSAFHLKNWVQKKRFDFRAFRRDAFQTRRGRN